MDRRFLSVFVSSAAVLLSVFLGSASAQVSCSGVPAFAYCTAYASGASVTYNGSKYTSIAPIPNNRDCPPNSPFSPGTDNWWTNNGTCSGGGGATATPTRPPNATATATTPSGGGSGSQNFQAAFWTQGDDPCTHQNVGGNGQPWYPKGSCSGSGCWAAWSASAVYTGGAQVSRNCSGGSNPTPTTPPNATPTRTSPPPTPTTGSGGSGGAAGLRFCPYIDVSPGSGSAIMQLASNGSGNKCYSLAFILGAGCQASWFGAFPLNTAEAAGIGSRIQELKNAGGNVIISFGGAAAPELANVCPNASALAAQYQAVINMYHPMAVDFDIEDFNPTAIDIRNQALTMISGAPIHYTLGVLQSGLTSSQTSVLSNARSHGVNVSMVNIMAMDYGGAVGDMYSAAISAANATKSQLSSLGYGGAQLGITPMIGQNDQAGEIFTIANANSLRANAAGASMLAFWSVGRDNGGCAGSGAASPSCSGVSQSAFQFSKILQSY
jgi:chitinase